MNDRVDIALATKADGIHAGQSDISLFDVRRLAPGKIAGVSAATVTEAQQASESGADYLGVGAFFPTASKADANLYGLSGLRAIRAAV